LKHVHRRAESIGFDIEGPPDHGNVVGNQVANAHIEIALLDAMSRIEQLIHPPSQCR